MAWEKWVKRAVLTLKISPHPEQPDSIVDLSVGLLRIRVKQSSGCYLMSIHFPADEYSLNRLFHNFIKLYSNEFFKRKCHFLIAVALHEMVRFETISWRSHILAKLWEHECCFVAVCLLTSFSMASFCLRKHRKKLIPVHESLNRNSFIRTETTRRN